ncbi:MAG: hypothetical protein AAGJ40_09285 [Planctomycetota bacterium]
MRLTSAPDDPTGTGLIQRMSSESGLVELGIYRSPTNGSSIRAGFVGMPHIEIDWCCGWSRRHIVSHYTAAYLYLSRRDETYRCFDGLPVRSVHQVCWKDDAFEKALTAAMLTVPGVSESCQTAP